MAFDNTDAPAIPRRWAFHIINKARKAREALSAAKWPEKAAAWEEIPGYTFDGGYVYGPDDEE